MEQKYKNQLREIKKNRLDREEKERQIRLLTENEYKNISKQFWPRISKVCREFALSAGRDCREDNETTTINTKFYVTKNRCRIGYSVGESISYPVEVHLVTQCSSDNKLCSYVYIDPSFEFGTQPSYIYINQFTEELLITKLREAMKV